MVDQRRILGTFAVLSLVLLRLTIGWHFFREGVEKVEYSPHTGKMRMAFSADGFLGQAKGPMAPYYHAFLPNDHEWATRLAVARQNVPLTDAEAAERSKWQTEYEQRRAAAVKEKKAPPVEFAPSAPYHDWAQQVADDWRAVLTQLSTVPGLSDEQKRRAADAYQMRVQQLSDYLAEESDAITDYQHELWRLAQWRAAPEAEGVPFQQQRISTKAAETARSATAWVNQVGKFEQNYFDDVRGVLTPEQVADATASAGVEGALNPHASQLRWVNIGVTILTIGVGLCLLFGFFTRLAALVGAFFLLSVMASQPFWLAEAVPTTPQAIEFAGLLVLAGTHTGRWLGLDYFTYLLFHRRRNVEVEVINKT